MRIFVRISADIDMDIVSMRVSLIPNCDRILMTGHFSVILMAYRE